MPTVTHQQAFDIALDHHRAGRLAEAEGIYRQLLALDPNNSDLVHLLGLVAYNARNYPPARQLIERAIAMNPNVARYHNNLGTLLLDLGEYDRALAEYRIALQLEPRNPAAWYNSGVVHTSRSQWDLAINAYRTALEFDPDYPACALNLGTALAASGQLDAGIALYRAEMLRRPKDGAIATNLGNLLKERGDTDAAIEIYGVALDIDANDGVTINNLAVALKDQGRLADSITAFRRSLELKPDNAEIRSNLILTLFYEPCTVPATVAEEQRKWNRHHLDPLRASHHPHLNVPISGRRLRIGYVSADFRDHVVGRALLPVFERHDPAQFDLACYSCGQHDAITVRFMSRAGLWREITNMPEDKVAAQIREDRVDILVDLSLHTSDNRLGVFARRPAPVQISWLGYPGTAGIETIDCHITDSFLEPLDADPASSPGHPLRLPDCWTCYEPPAGYPPVNELPALQSGHVTFGSFNSFFKINDRVLDIWTQILRAIEGSRLVLLSKSGGHRTRVAEFLRARGIDPGRLDFLDYRSAADGRPQSEFLRRYEGIDVALDTFPYNGMTTTCDALWMGVPVVALIGGAPISRASFSLLSNVGVPELAAASDGEYVRIATELARDIPRLTELRATLRERMKSSPLLDAPRFARNLETAFRAIWRKWCERAQAGAAEQD